MIDDLLRIGEVAERVGLSLRTVRYYEEMGLIAPEKRTEGGYRLYTEDHVDQLRLIKQMKPLGFTIQEMVELLDARRTVHDDDALDDARAAAADRLTEYARAAAARCDELAEQLERAEEFADGLRRETRRVRRRVKSRT